MDKQLITALPLVASALGRKYGVNVYIRGGKAYTDGKDIYLPALPAKADEDTLKLVRGYLDHESAHLRHTDFDLAVKSKLEPMEKYVWNILEDVMVEEKQGAIYPGCKQNLMWLARKVFLNKEKAQAASCQDAQDIFNWLLLKVRSRTLPELERESKRYEASMDVNFPNLRMELERVISRRAPSPDTRGCVKQAREIVNILKNYLGASKRETKENKDSERQSEGEAERAESAADSGSPQSPENQLKELMADPDKLVLRNVGEEAGKMLEKAAAQSERISIAQAVKSLNPPLSAKDVYEARRETAALRSRLAALLQSKIIVRKRVGYSGKIMTGRLASLAVNNTRIFARQGQKGGVSAALHLLVDVSGSMGGEKIRLAGLSAYALVEALKNAKGLSLGVSAFPNGPISVTGSDRLSWDTINPVLRHNERPHSRFSLNANGSTPMAEALWWVLQEVSRLPERRKIILIISDGEPDSLKDTVAAVEACKKCGIEVYGIGIQASYITHLLPEHSRLIWDLKDLAPAMFGLLHNALLGGSGK